jgi:hypothetical protein
MMDENFDYDDYPPDAKFVSDFDSDIYELISVCKKITQTVPKAYFPQLFDELVNATDNVEVWYEHDDNPKANGWVDSKGRP